MLPRHWALPVTSDPSGQCLDLVEAQVQPHQGRQQLEEVLREDAQHIPLKMQLLPGEEEEQLGTLSSPISP